MHFSIPDTADITDSKGSTFTVFNIHINGVYHCSTRYSQLYDFYVKLKKEFSTLEVPSFPPKKLLSLSMGQLDERRIDLERFIQQISQIAPIANGSTFNSFLLAAQKESQHQTEENVSLDVYLSNGHKVSVNIVSTNRTDKVLQSVAEKIELGAQFIPYFGLFLVRRESGNQETIIRRLQEFESPFISLRASSLAGTHWIMLKKVYWETSYDDDLLEDRVAMNLLYVEAVQDIEKGWVITNKEQHDRVTSLIQKNSKREFLRFGRTLKFYGYIVFKPCITDHPEPDTQVIVSAGNKELNFRLQLKREEREMSFKVTRMRCWRISSLLPDVSERVGTDGSTAGGGGEGVGSRLELSFEYLVARNCLKWITLYSSQAILMSMCLQGMVDELIMKKDGHKVKRPQEGDKQSADQSSQVSNMKGTVSTTRSLSTSSSIGSLSRHANRTNKVTGRSLVSGATTDNSAFDGIDDEDL